MWLEESTRQGESSVVLAARCLVDTNGCCLVKQAGQRALAVRRLLLLPARFIRGRGRKMDSCCRYGRKVDSCCRYVNHVWRKVTGEQELLLPGQPGILNGRWYLVTINCRGQVHSHSRCPKCSMQHLPHWPRQGTQG